MLTMAHSEIDPPTPSEPAPFILAVDDDLVHLRVVQNTLEKHGYLVKTARSGEEALQILREEVPAVLILDVVMPGMSGFDVGHIVKRNSKLEKTPVIFLTAQDSPENFKAGQEAGGVFYMPKPIRPDRLLNVVSMFCAPPKK